MERKTLDALLTLAGIDPVAVHQLANKYWPDCDAYAQLRRDNPWWLVLTKAGPVVIGRRKRVISINWAETGIRAKMTADDQTTSELEYCHAWTYEKAVEYLSTLQSALKLAASSVSEPQTAQIVELANLIAERDALKAELQALRGSAEPVAWMYYDAAFPSQSYQLSKTRPIFESASLSVIPLYTHPAVKLPDEQIAEAMDVWHGERRRSGSASRS